MGVQFWSDRRAVSEVVGAVLLLGILILALTSYQAVMVPNQNAETEFQHNLQVENEMVDLRNAVLEARSSGTQTFGSITLGTQYRDRIIAINPPPATGSLQTVRQDNISVAEGGGTERPDPLGLDERPLENQFIEYTPRYFEYQSAGTMRFENTVTYHQYPDANITLTNQRLLQDDRVTLAPIEGTINEQGTRRVTVDQIPGVLQTTDVEDPEISLPTKLSESDWNEILDDELSSGESAEVDDGVLTLNLSGTYEIAYSPVGANRAPREGVRGGSAGEINPASPGNIQLVGTDWGGDGVRLTFRNSAGDNSFTQGRVNFYFSSSQGGTPDKVEDVYVVDANGNAVGESRSSDWIIGEDFEAISPKIELAGEGERTRIRLDFDGNPNENNDFFIVTLALETGERATYFVGGSYEAEEDDNGENGDDEDNNNNNLFYPDRADVVQGQLNNFENMQSDNGAVAEFRRDGGDDFDIDITTDNVPAGEHTLEIKVDDEDLSGNRVFDIEVTGEQDGQLAVDEIESGDETVRITLDPLTEEQDVTVNYAANGNDDLDIDYQRIELE